MRIRLAYLIPPVLALAGCVHYQPRNISPSVLNSEFRARSLQDGNLQEFLGKQGVDTAAIRTSVDSRTLVLTGYFYSPDLRVARARLAAAMAAVDTARLRPVLSLSGDGGYNTSPESHAMYTIAPSFTIETAGKRGLRIIGAEKQAEAARAAVIEAGWLVRSRVRIAMFQLLLAQRRVALLSSDVAIRTEIVDIFDKRLSAGESPRPELDLYRVELLNARAALDVATGELAQARIQLATAAGLPAAALASVRISEQDLETLPQPASLSPVSVHAAGVVHRADVRRALAEYGAADAALRLEVAQQYPDLQLTPTYNFEEGFGRYVIGAGLQPLTGVRRTRLLVRQAEAQREIAATQFQAVQAQAIGEIDAAVQQYAAAYQAWESAGARVISVQRSREEAARRALAVGEGDRLAVATARLETNTAQRNQLDAQTRVAGALTALEASIQNSLTSGTPIDEPPVNLPGRSNP